jgi:hypothetical protein
MDSSGPTVLLKYSSTINSGRCGCMQAKPRTFIIHRRSPGERYRLDTRWYATVTSYRSQSASLNLSGTAQDWEYLRSQLRANVPVARQLLRKIFPDRITLTPRLVEKQWMYHYAAQAQVGGIIGGILGAKSLVSPTGPSESCNALAGHIEALALMA